MRKRDLLENVKNIVWALVFAIALWLVMAQSQQTSEKVKATLLVRASGVNVIFPHQDQRKLDITVRGSAGDLARMNRDIDGVFVVPDDWKMGRRKIPVKEFEFLLDPGIEVDRSALTQEVEVDLAKETRSRLVIEIDLDRKPPEGWEIEEPTTVEPRELDASGPIDIMAGGPKLRTEPVSLEKMLEKFGFDKKSRDTLSYEQTVSVLPPPNSGISLRETRAVKVRVTIRPKPFERELDLVPSFHFAGPVFEGLPFKLTPFGRKDKVVVSVSGPELDLLDSTIEGTKARFVVFAAPKAEISEKGKIKVGDILRFDVTVIPPPGIKLLKEPNPKELQYNVEALDTGSGSGDK